MCKSRAIQIMCNLSLSILLSRGKSSELPDSLGGVTKLPRSVVQSVSDTFTITSASGCEWWRCYQTSSDRLQRCVGGLRIVTGNHWQPSGHGISGPPVSLSRGTKKTHEASNIITLGSIDSLSLSVCRTQSY